MAHRATQASAIVSFDATLQSYLFEQDACSFNDPPALPPLDRVPDLYFSPVPLVYFTNSSDHGQ